MQPSKPSIQSSAWRRLFTLNQWMLWKSKAGPLHSQVLLCHFFPATFVRATINAGIHSIKHVDCSVLSAVFNSHVDRSVLSAVFNTHVDRSVLSAVFNSHVDCSVLSAVFNSHVDRSVLSAVFNSYVLYGQESTEDIINQISCWNIFVCRTWQLQRNRNENSTTLCSPHLDPTETQGKHGRPIPFYVLKLFWYMKHIHETVPLLTRLQSFKDIILIFPNWINN